MDKKKRELVEFNNIAEAFNEIAKSYVGDRLRYTYTVSLSIEPIPEVEEKKQMNKKG